MQEDIQKNFILLSKVAKEKKYAQEYLGLLARRGDIGSIRIGKRWYTTWAWFEEFLENGLKKKTESVPEVQEIKFEKVDHEIVLEKVAAGEMKINFSPVIPVKKEAILSSIEEEPAFAKAAAGEEVKINIPFENIAAAPVFVPPSGTMASEGEKVSVDQPAISMQREKAFSGEPAKISVAVKTKKSAMPVWKNVKAGFGDIRAIGVSGEMRKARTQPRIVSDGKYAPERKVQPILQDEPRLRNISVEERNRYAAPYKEIKLKKKEDIFSPNLNLAGEAKIGAQTFSRFAFAMSFASVLLLVAASGYFIWSGGLLARGQVAGASDERNAVFSGITSEGRYVLMSAGDKMRESLSISRVIVQAAKEKSANESSTQSEGDSKAVLITN